MTKNINDQLAAVKQNGYAIEHIENPSKEVQLAAVQRDIRVMRCIKNPCKEVQVQDLLNRLLQFPFYSSFSKFNSVSWIELAAYNKILECYSDDVVEAALEELKEFTK